MMRYLILLFILFSSQVGADVYLRLGLFLNPNEFERGSKDPIIDNPVFTIGGRWQIPTESDTKQFHFFIEHESGVFTGESYMGINQLGVEVTFN